MMKRFFELFGLAIMAVGIYVVVAEQSKNTACNASEGKFAGLGMSASCQHVVYVYFGGFLLLAAGALVVVYGILATRRSAKKQAPRKPSLAAQYQWIDPKTGRSSQS